MPGLDSVLRNPTTTVERGSPDSELARAHEAVGLVTWLWDVEARRLHWTGDLSPLLGLPPGRFGATMVARAKSPDGAFAVHGLDACAARGLFAGPKDLLAVNYHLLVPDAVRAGAARETMVDALARSGTAFVFRHASAGFVPDGALAAAEIAALEALVAHGKLARVVLGGSVPWSATTTRAVQAADDRLARRLGAGERFTLLVLGTAPPD